MGDGDNRILGSSRIETTDFDYAFPATLSSRQASRRALQNEDRAGADGTYPLPSLFERPKTVD
jgi:hypothetical protein